MLGREIKIFEVVVTEDSDPLPDRLAHYQRKQNANIRAVNVISKPGLLMMAKKHPETLPTLTLWYKVARKVEWRGLHEVRREYPSADQVGDVLIFDVLGGNFRLMTRVNYNGQRIYVKALLNHREYDRKEWMKWA